ncbi:AAA family ATPase [Sinanaerobacter sp. ZZT-01]|uniref:AAA family ATPase n=1 Tax=Sinanaerobacter sp. ZZT-01 TaxID=3111540 RepID=UPI002D7939EA|nr:AAA family ATPase [Sinanaerobacter sp. ZZT-01]WRR93114.1 AAA family ATPase [Sinanaerobacter sp. ZZT-01]
MVYLRGFEFSKNIDMTQNIYPYNILSSNRLDTMFFDSITLLYGGNASGKSSILNILANHCQLNGLVSSQAYGKPFFQYVSECKAVFADEIVKLPPESKYIKSEDILNEVKQVEDKKTMLDAYIRHCAKTLGIESADETTIERRMHSVKLTKALENLEFSKEKYSNGEVAFQILEDEIKPDSLYLLDEPETSLSPSNQIKLADEIRRSARLLGCQFIIATHSPFLLGILDGKIYDLDQKEITESKWYDLENIRTYYNFFKEKEICFQ